MAITFEEAVEDQTFEEDRDGTTASLVFYVYGAGSVYQACTAPGLPVVGAVYNARDYTNPAVPVDNLIAGLTCQKVECTNINLQDSFHEVTASYETKNTSGGSSSAPDNPVDGDEFWTIRAGGDTTLLSTATYGQIAYGTDAPDIGNLIGVSDTGEVEGVQIIDEVDTLTVTAYKAVASVDNAYINVLRSFRGTTNIVAWYGAEIESTLFVGFNIEDYDSTLKIITFEFRIGKNKTASELGAVAGSGSFKDKDGTSYSITGGKNAWQYLWTQGGTNVVADKVTRYNKGVWVTDVYLPVSWAGLGLENDLYP